jgi:two-component system OmpR family sensor kinase/two-component system sensor histidine kinase BaeS
MSSRLWNNSLHNQIVRSFLLIILITAAIIILFVEYTPLRSLAGIAPLVGRQRAAQLRPFLVEHYKQTGSWEALPALLAEVRAAPPPTPLLWRPRFPLRAQLIREPLVTERVLLVDEKALVLYDSTNPAAVGSRLTDENLLAMTAIVVNGRIVGRLLVTPRLTAAGEALIQRILRGTVVLAGGIAAVVGLVVSILLSQRLSTPLRQLNLAAQQLAAGGATELLPVRQQDEIGELTQTFNQMVTALAEQHQLRKQMVADIAHELRTPLSIMQLEIEGMADGLQSPAVAAQHLREQIGALTGLVEDLRLLSLADAGGLALQSETIDLAALLATVLASWRSHAQSRGLTLQLHPSIPDVQIPGDQSRLAQVFNNLISNAIQYTPTGGAITLNATIRATEVCCTVTDTGPGISADALPYLFERFYRADPSRNRATGGSGLGLSIAKRLVELHSGRIWVESVVGQGTTFFVALPLAPK